MGILTELLELLGNFFRNTCMGEIFGRIGTEQFGYDLRAQWDGERLQGRIGSEFIGKDLNLQLAEERLKGYVGKAFFGPGFKVRGQVSKKELHVRLGGIFIGTDVNLNLEGKRLYGHLASFDKDENIELRCDGQLLTGQIRGIMDGRQINLTVNSVPLTLAALASICTFKVLQEGATV